MNIKDESLVQTCGLCKIICDQSEVANHSCLKGYTQYIIDPQTFYFYPLLDDGVTMIRKIVQNNEEHMVATRLQEKETDSIISIRRGVLFEVQNASKKTQRNSNEGIRGKLNYDDEETLILEVQSREPLWNYKLPLPQRNIRIVKKLWQEVANALDGKLTADEAKVKFKSLHDTYRRIIRLETCANASARKESGKKWAHYNSMEFMRDSCLLKTRVSNIEDPLNNDLEDSSESVENIGSNREFQNKRKKSDSNTCTNAIKRNANALCDNDVMPDLPPPSVSDEIIRSETCASGSARKESGKKWTHYNSMEFMRDSCLLKTRVSNIEDPINNDLEDSSKSVENIGPNRGLQNKKKRRKDCNTCTSTIEQIANALCNNNDVMPDLPPPPVPDEIDSFLSMLGCQLRELALRKRREVMKQILTVTYDVLTEQYE